MSESGTLFVCATPIGHLGDVTHRVLDTLGSADIIAAEDTRVTRKLLARYEIETPMQSFHAHNAEQRTPALLERIEAGELVALVSDAGTPGISDPGAGLVDAALERELPVEVLPGPSAIITALVASGLPTHAFYFGGFLPRKPGPRQRMLESLSGLDATLIFYESPRRTAATLESVARSLPGRTAAVARELTKMHEEVRRGSVGELARSFKDRELKGEVVLLVGPPDDVELEVDEDVVAAQVQGFVRAGMSTRDAVRQVAAERGIPRNIVYRIAVEGQVEEGA